MSVLQTLRSAAGHLADAHARFALVGGLAVSTRAEPRNTRAVDLAVAVQDDVQAEGLTLPVARAGHLLAMKLLAMDDALRPQDRVDVAALIASADATEIARARQACDDIVARGLSRGRDLPRLLREACALYARKS